MKITMADGRTVDHRALRNSISRVLRASARSVKCFVLHEDAQYLLDAHRVLRLTAQKQLRGLAACPGRYARRAGEAA